MERWCVRSAVIHSFKEVIKSAVELQWDASHVQIKNQVNFSGVWYTWTQIDP